jgi:hypothetical protein
MMWKDSLDYLNLLSFQLKEIREMDSSQNSAENW